MPIHLALEALLVDDLPAIPGELRDHLERETVGRDEGERLLRADDLRALEVVEEAHPALERLEEAFLLGGKRAVDRLPVLDQFGERMAHLRDHDVGEPRQEALEPDRAGIHHRAPDHAPQHVPAALVRRRDSIRDEERHAAAVVGEHAMRPRRLGRVAVRDARLRLDPAHDVLKAVGVVDGRDVLHDARGPLETQAGVDVLLRQRRQRPVGMQLVRHEDEVPELEEPLAPGASGRAVGEAASDLLAPVVVDLGVGSARAGSAHGPEVLRRRQRHDALRRYADPLPQVDRDLVRPQLELGIAGVDAHPEPVPVQLQVVADELRRELDRALLEVLAEREVAQHLEEREVVGVEPDLVDVLRPEALLRGGRHRRRRRLAAEEIRHLRLHARGRQERRAVVGARNQRSRGPPEVPLRLEKREKALA